MSKQPLALVFSLLLLGAATGCEQLDNSGGPPPEGEALSYLVEAEPSLFCGGLDAAALIEDAQDADAWLAECDDPDWARDLIDERLAQLDDNQALVAVSAQLGGCTQDFNVHGVYRDGDHVTVWILKQDTSYGRQQVACTSDIGEGHALVTVDDAADAITIDVHVSAYNPELNGGPAVDSESQASAQ